MLETDWTSTRDLFLFVLALMLLPLLISAGGAFDRYLLKKFDERKAKKTR